MTADRKFGVFSLAKDDRKDRDFQQSSHTGIKFEVELLAIEYLHEFNVRTVSFKSAITS